MRIDIRPYEPTYLEDVIALSLRAWEPVFVSVKQNFDPELYEYYYPDWRVHQEKDVKKACSDKDLKVWVSVQDGTITGFVAYRLDASEKTGEIHMIAVDPDFQRQGISASLIEFATQKMQEAQMEICMIGTGADPGHAPARMAYEKSGFKPWHNVIYFKRLQTKC
ncbi:MAG: GNAT family N-acetyltransferase [Gammaproteobacteria bacterium]|nr:GNAT family N-acetyltransferase [Gammaproteobacteria bacterium]MBT8439999.1 GNAT family N-acetyltransferase [Gammaproteobacteria bacterium]